ncbi:hypothetical protein Ahu01nite_040400 [Winogradskya humida]|uniref:Uncharacterized protein n=1 Tax=Winogradskya humida TaxID=113566 RepID=A0ABQ3ZQV6_9ACTN|nr:hypothetical protein Ahu01nite_040400 [Actinoplanes humidus]
MQGAGEAGPGKRRWWLVALVAAWGVVLAGGVVWSVRNDPPTVAEQRDIGDALPLVERVTGAVLAAADGPDRTVELGALRFDRGCSLTPVRGGVEASRDVVVRVRDDQAAGVLESIAEGLPAGYGAGVRHNAASTRFALHADAGEFVGVDSEVADTSRAVTVTVSTGCRPLSEGVDYAPAPVVPPLGEVPDAFLDALSALQGERVYSGVEVACPDGRVARTFVADDVKGPADLGRALRDVTGGAVVVRADAGEWAYRVGEVSVVVTEGDGVARVAATISCR